MSKDKILKIELEKKGQFPSKNCECHWQEPYGFVPEADCPEHDTKQFSDFLDTMRDETLGEVEKTGKRYKSERYKTDQFVIPGKKWDKLKTKPKETKE